MEALDLARTAYCDFRAVVLEPRKPRNNRLIVRNVYECMRMVGQALFLVDGTQESKHEACIWRLCGEDKEADKLRYLRHAVNYQGYTPSSDETAQAIDTAKRLMKSGLEEIALQLDEFHNKFTRPCLYVMVGLPGSGKTTYVDRNLFDCGVVRYEDLHETVAPISRSNGFNHGLVERIEEAMIRDFAWNKRSVVVDRPNETRKKRKRYLDLVQKYRIATVAVCFAPDVDKAIAQALQRDISTCTRNIGEYAKRFEVPTHEEGFDAIKKIGFSGAPPGYVWKKLIPLQYSIF